MTINAINISQNLKYFKMKKLLLVLLIIPTISCSQGEQLYADGVATDQDGNQFEWINYGTQDWAIENAKVVTYRDGTPIPQITDANEWSNLTTDAWAYYDNDPTKPRLYNGYAAMGIYDTASLSDASLRKEFAPEGWHVPTDTEWITLKNYLIANGYNYDGTTTENKIAKSMASTTGWNSSETLGAPGNDQGLNNRSGFNCLPEGGRSNVGSFDAEGIKAFFWSSTEGSPLNGFWNILSHNYSGLTSSYQGKKFGYSVRFVRDAQTASVDDNSIYNFKIFPNPTKEYINIDCSSLESVSIYNILGKKLIKETSNRINVSSLSKGVYFIKVSDGINSSTKKFIKN